MLRMVQMQQVHMREVATCKICAFDISTFIEIHYNRMCTNGFDSHNTNTHET